MFSFAVCLRKWLWNLATVVSALFLILIFNSNVMFNEVTININKEIINEIQTIEKLPIKEKVRFCLLNF